MNENDILFFDDIFENARSAQDDYGLILTSSYVSFPEPKTLCYEIPFSDSVMESGVGEDIYYKQREMLLDFRLEGSAEENNMSLSRLANDIHGQYKKVLDTNDRTFYYEGRLRLDRMRTEDAVTHVRITGMMDPYKYELYSGVEDWLWNDFCFDEGIVREYKNLQVNNQLRLVIPGRRKKVIPVITVSAEMTVNFDGRSYRLQPGQNKIYSLKLGEGNNVLMFTGSGKLSVDYRGGSL